MIMFAKLFWLALFITLAADVFAVTQNFSRPNVIIMFADDLGFGDLSFAGHPTSSSPRLDSLARNSAFFTQNYVTMPICSPSRASLLTGRYPMRMGIYPGVFEANSVNGLPLNEITIAALLKEQGYRTHIVGKWHLGIGRNREYLPTNFGFDSYLGIPYSHDMCPCLKCFPGDLPCYDECATQFVSCPLFQNSTIIEQPADLTTLTEKYAESALTFITESAMKKNPFFLYLPFHQTHHPQFSSAKFYHKSKRGHFGDALAEMDWMVGEVVDILSHMNIAENTIIWFTSDNGPSMLRKERGGCAGPLRCGKGTTWEGGVRTPAFVHWPSHIVPARSEALVSTLDILPTLVSILKFSTGDLVLDGFDMSTVLFDATSSSPRHMMAIYPFTPYESEGPFAITNGSFKAHFYTKGNDLSDPHNYDPMCSSKSPRTKHSPPLLFNLEVDPGERYNLGDNENYQDVIKYLATLRDEHMSNMSWTPGLTGEVSDDAEACCNPNTPCTPFPKCCDCHNKGTYWLDRRFNMI